MEIDLSAAGEPIARKPLYRQLYRELGIARGPVTPDGVYARVVDGRTLYVNTNRQPAEVAIDGKKQGLLSGKQWNGKLLLGANGVEIAE